MKIKLLTPMLIVLVGLVFNSCNRHLSESDYVSDYDIVYTHYNQKANFKAYSTFAIPDKIPYLSDPNGQNQEEEYLDDDNPSLADLIRTKIRNNLSGRGYTEVDEHTDTPDLLVSLGILNSTTIGAFDSYCDWYDNGYYWGWYPDWDWELDWGWGYYPCWGGTLFSYTFGSLVIDVADVKETSLTGCESMSSSCRLNIAWSAFIRGLLTDNGQSLNTRITTAIDQSFTQSDYFRK
ncbi:MAG: DUF4136 domain-containing protein [Niabella sp.]